MAVAQTDHAAWLALRDARRRANFDLRNSTVRIQSLTDQIVLHATKVDAAAKAVREIDDFAKIHGWTLDWDGDA